MSRRTSGRLGKKRPKAPTLNLTNFMDVLTLLLFFLLVNSSGSNPLQSPAGLTPPTTFSAKPPREGIVAVVVTPEEILIQNESVMTVQNARSARNPELNPVIAKLREIRAKSESIGLEIAEGEDNPADELAILADSKHDYQLIRKILISGRKAGFTTLTFAATQK